LLTVDGDELLDLSLSHQKIISSPSHETPRFGLLVDRGLLTEPRSTCARESFSTESRTSTSSASGSTAETPAARAGSHSANLRRTCDLR